MLSLLLMSMDRVDGETETLVEEEADLPAMVAVTPLASCTSAGCMTSSQPLAFSFAVCTEPLPVTVVFASAVSSLMSVLPVVTMVEAALVSRSQTEASSERLAPSPVTVTSEKPPAFAERPLSESEAEDCTSAVPILVEPVAITVGLMPIGLETMRFIAVTPSSVTLPPPTMISPLTVTLFRLTLPESTPSVM